MHVPLRILFLAAFAVVAVQPASAQVDPTTSIATLPGPATIMVLPSGIGPGLNPAGVVITVQVFDVTGVAMGGLTAADFEVDGVPPAAFADGFRPPATWNVPPAGFTSSTTPGIYFLRGPFIGGGWCNAALVKVQGVQIQGAPLPLAMNSPDNNGDGTVNIADVGTFTVDLYGFYHWRSDFNGDGTINLADVGFMATGLGSTYPPGYITDPVD